MTPYQLNLCIKDYNIRKKAEDEEKLILTYLGAYWNRIKHMPSLASILKKEQPKNKMSPEEVLDQIKKINTSLGGNVY